MARNTPVFISYARSDERYATELMRQDRIRMSPGDFEDQLKAETVRQAHTLGEIAAVFEYDSEDLIAVNDWIWSATPETIVSGPLQKDDEVSLPDPDFVPILAAPFAAEAVVVAGLTPDVRTRMLQRLVRMALPNPTAADAVLGRLILATLNGPQQLPAMLTGLRLPDAADAGSPAEGRQRVSGL